MLYETQLTRGSLSMPAGEGQSVEGAPRRRAAPGNQLVRVAAGAATGRQTKCCASAGIATTPPGRAKFAPVKRQCTSDRHLREVRSEPRPCAQAQRLHTSRATTGVGASAHARHASATFLLREQEARAGGFRAQWSLTKEIRCALPTRNLTRRSSGRSKACCARYSPPLISNVRPQLCLH